MIEWQYNGAAPMKDIVAWCSDSLAVHTWKYHGWETIVFYNDTTWTMFRLRWM